MHPLMHRFEKRLQAAAEAVAHLPANPMQIVLLRRIGIDAVKLGITRGQAGKFLRANGSRGDDKPAIAEQIEFLRRHGIDASNSTFGQALDAMARVTTKSVSDAISRKEK